MSHFPPCIAHVLAAEGGLVNHPQDPGGVTKFGISQRSYPDLDIPALTVDQAIYERDYWAPIMGDDLTAGFVGLVVLHRQTRHQAPVGPHGHSRGGIMGPVVIHGPHRRTIGCRSAAMPRIAPRWSRPGRPWIFFSFKEEDPRDPKASRHGALMAH